MCRQACTPSTGKQAATLQTLCALCAEGKEIDGFDALVFSSDTSDADNQVHRQLVIVSEHTGGSHSGWHGVSGPACCT